MVRIVETTRGVLGLNAASVTDGRHALLVLADSGQGKSSTMRAIEESATGIRVISDETTLVSADTGLVVDGYFPHLALYDPAAEGAFTYADGARRLLSPRTDAKVAPATIAGLVVLRRRNSSASSLQSAPSSHVSRYLIDRNLAGVKPEFAAPYGHAEKSRRLAELLALAEGRPAWLLDGGSDPHWRAHALTRLLTSLSLVEGSTVDA